MIMKRASFGPVGVEAGHIACHFIADIDGETVEGTYDPEATKNEFAGGVTSTVDVILDGEPVTLFVIGGKIGPNGICGTADHHPLEG